MVGVQVGVDHVGDVVAAFLGEVDVRLDLELRIHDQRLAGLARGDEI